MMNKTKPINPIAEEWKRLKREKLDKTFFVDLEKVIKYRTLLLNDTNTHYRSLAVTKPINKVLSSICYQKIKDIKYNGLSVGEIDTKITEFQDSKRVDKFNDYLFRRSQKKPKKYEN